MHYYLGPARARDRSRFLVLSDARGFLASGREQAETHLHHHASAYQEAASRHRHAEAGEADRDPPEELNFNDRWIEAEGKAIPLNTASRAAIEKLAVIPRGEEASCGRMLAMARKESERKRKRGSRLYLRCYTKRVND